MTAPARKREPNLHIKRVDAGEFTSLRLFGELDRESPCPLRAAFTGCLVEQRRRLVVNLSGVTFVSMLGVGTLVDAKQRFQAVGGDIQIVGANVYTQRLFRMTGVQGLLPSFETEALAIAALEQWSQGARS